VLRADGTYTLCQPACGSGRFTLGGPGAAEGYLVFQGGPMPVFMHRVAPDARDRPDTSETWLSYTRMGTEIELGDTDERYFSGGCYMGWSCRDPPWRGS
jgi:hypothetical protein